MIIAIEELLENALQTGTAGISGGNKQLGNLIGQAFSGIYNGLSNLFTGASNGSSISGSTLTTDTTRLQNEIPTISNTQLARASQILTDYKEILDALGTTADLHRVTLNINDIITADAQIKPLLNTINEIISFGKYSIEATGFVTWNFVSIKSTNGNSGEKDKTSEIESWYTNIMDALTDLGYLSYETKRIDPLNFFVHGGNAAGVVITGVQDTAWVAQYIKSLKDTYSQFNNLLDYIEGEILQIIAATNNVIGVSVEEAQTYTPIEWDILTLEQIEEIVKTLDLSLSLTKTIQQGEEEDEKKKKFKKKLGLLAGKNNKKKPKKPKMIKSISMKTPKSKWISKITFTFPVKKDIKSNDKGTMKFYLKKGGSITKVRVKRGTFSVIALWSNGSNLGVGYRYWSQFNKKNIVNVRKVLSWFIPLIKPQDRDIAIPMEIREKVIKYD